jgi:hypothetical protein
MLVTAIFDLQKHLVDRSPPNTITKTYWRDPLQYVSLVRWIQRLERPVVVFAESHMIHHFQKPEYESNLVPIEVSLDDLPSWKRLMEHPNLEPAIPSVTAFPEYTAAITSKTYLLKLAMKHVKENPTLFEGRFGELSALPLIWIDAGLDRWGPSHPAKFTKELQVHIDASLGKSKESDQNKELFSFDDPDSGKERITLVSMFSTSTQDYADMYAYMKSNRARIAGGLIIVPPSLVEWLDDQIQILNSQILKENKLLVLEEQLLSIISNEHPRNFRYIYGYYRFITNLTYVIQKADTVAGSLCRCRILADNITGSPEYNQYYQMGRDILQTMMKTFRYAGMEYTRKLVGGVFMDGLRLTMKRDTEVALRLGRLIHYLWHHNSGAKAELNENNDLRECMIVVGLNLDEDPGNGILNEEVSEYLWGIL